jgi:acetyl esterase/lipase
MPMHLFRLWSRALAALLTLTSCSAADLLNATVPEAGYRRVADIAYGRDPRQRLDIYIPRQPDPSRATIVFFYGGAWDSGRRQDYRFVAQALSDAGFWVVVPDYRLFPQVRFPAFVEDGAAAVRWTRSHIAAHGGDPGRLFLAGHSAGAHIALMLATGTPFLAADGVDRTTIRGVIGIAGPYDFLPLSSARLREVFAGSDPDTTQPINHVGPGLPPALLLHGDADSTVRVRNTHRLAAAWQAAGNTVDMKIYRDVGHIGILTAFSDVFRGRAPTLADTAAFVRAHAR